MHPSGLLLCLGLQLSPGTPTGGCTEGGTSASALSPWGPVHCMFEPVTLDYEFLGVGMRHQSMTSCLWAVALRVRVPGGRGTGLCARDGGRGCRQRGCGCSVGAEPARDGDRPPLCAGGAPWPLSPFPPLLLSAAPELPTLCEGCRSASCSGLFSARRTAGSALEQVAGCRAESSSLASTALLRQGVDYPLGMSLRCMRALQTAKEGKALRALLRGQVERLRELASRNAGISKQGVSHSASPLPTEDAAEAPPAQAGVSEHEEGSALAPTPHPLKAYRSEAGAPALAAVQTRVGSGASELAGQPSSDSIPPEAPAERGELGGQGLPGMPDSGMAAATGLPREPSTEVAAGTKIEAQVRSMYTSWKQRRRVTARAEDTLQALRTLDSMQQRMLELRTSLRESETALATALLSHRDAGATDATEQHDSLPHGFGQVPVDAWEGGAQAPGTERPGHHEEVPGKHGGTSPSEPGPFAGPAAERPGRRRILGSKTWDVPPEESAKAVPIAEQQREVVTVADSGAL